MFFDELAKLKEVIVEDAPQTLYKELEAFYKYMGDLIEKEIQPLAETFQIAELLEKESKREELALKLTKFENIDKYNLKRVREIYSEVIPKVCTSN